MGKIMTEIRRQRNEIYEQFCQPCDTVVLGVSQSAQLWLECKSVYLLEEGAGKLSYFQNLEIREHPAFDGVLVLPRKEGTTMPLELTAEEEQLILKRREEEAQKKQARELALRRIRTAHGYAMWLEANGAGDTYSTFCGEFGYKAMEGERRTKTHDIIRNIWEIVGLEP